MIRTQKYNQLYTGAKEIRQLNPSGTGQIYVIRSQPPHLLNVLSHRIWALT